MNLLFKKMFRMISEKGEEWGEENGLLLFR